MGCLPRYLPEQLSLGAGVALAGAGELEQKQQVPGWEEDNQLAAEVRDERCWWSLRSGAGAEVTSPNCFAQQQEQQNDVPGSARRRSAC